MYIYLVLEGRRADGKMIPASDKASVVVGETISAKNSFINLFLPFGCVAAQTDLVSTAQI